MPDSHVLVVEADLSVRHTLADILAREGVKVSLAVDGHAGLALLEKKPFDVLFAGLRLPVMDGLTMLQRALLIRPQLAMVVLAGQGRLSSCQEAFRLGACDYLTRPFTPAAVHESLARALACGCRRHVAPVAGARASGAAGGCRRGGRRPLGRRESGDACLAGLRGENRPHRRRGPPPRRTGHESRPGGPGHPPAEPPGRLAPGPRRLQRDLRGGTGGRPLRPPAARRRGRRAALPRAAGVRPRWNPLPGRC